MNAFKPGVSRILQRDPVPVIPLALRGLWGSFFSRAYGSAMSRLLPRGMLSRIELVGGKVIDAGDATPERLTQALQDTYADAPFVRVRTDVLPATKYVSFTNFCDVYATMAKGKVLLFSALDNLIKGASGQAIQNMNLMFGWAEETGLEFTGGNP